MAEAQAVGIFPEEKENITKDKPYFEGDKSKVALEEVMQNYQMTVGKALDVPAEDVNVGNLFYAADMKPIPINSGDAPPHVDTAAGAPFSSVVYKAVSKMVRNDRGIPIPQYEYFGHGSPAHQNAIANNAPHTRLENNWVPGGTNEANERLWRGFVVDNHGNIFKHTDKTVNEVTDIMHGWNAGLDDRLNWGIDTLKHIRGYSSPTSPIEFHEEEYAEDDMVIGGSAGGTKVYNGAPYWMENTWMGNVLVANKNRSHFRFKPNQLGVMTEYSQKVGNMMAGTTVGKIMQMTTDIIPTVLDMESRALGSMYQYGVEQKYKFANTWEHFQFSGNMKIVDGRPVPVFNENDEPMKQHGFLWQIAKDSGENMDEWEEEHPWPKTSTYITSRAYSDLVTPFYSTNIIAGLLTPDADLSDQLLGKYTIPKDEFKKVVSGELQSASVRYPQEMLGFMASYKFFDRVIGKIAGTGSPRGKQIWGITKKNGEDIFKADPLRKGKTWKDTPDYVKEIYYKKGFHRYLLRPDNKNFPNLTSWLDKGRVNAHRNMKLYDNVNMLMSNNMAIAANGFSDLFSGRPAGSIVGYQVSPDYTDNPRPMIPYFVGAILAGLPTAFVGSSGAFQQGIMQKSFDPSQLTSYAKTSIKLVTTAMTGPAAVYDLLKSTIKRTGNTYSPLDFTINEMAALIPDNLNGVDLTQNAKLKAAKFILAARNNAIETGTIESFVDEIALGEQFINDLKQVLGQDGNGGTYGVEFAEGYKQVLTDLDNLIGLKSLDNIVATTTNIGFSINPQTLGESGNIVLQSRQNAMNLIRVLDDVMKWSPKAEGEAIQSVTEHLSKIRALAESEIKLSGERLEELKTMIGFNRELLTSEHYTGQLDNNRHLFRLLEQEIEINEAMGVDPKITAKLIQDTRLKANKNMVAVIYEMKSNSKIFTDEDAAALFVELDMAAEKKILTYGNKMYEEAELLLKDPTDLGSIYTTLKQSFFDINPAEGGIRPKDAATIGDIIGDAVQKQYDGILDGKYGNNIREIAEITQTIKEITGLQSLTTPGDFTKFYGVLRSKSKQGIELRDFLQEVAPAMIKHNEDFLIPGKSMMAVHKLLMASRRSLGEKQSSQYLAYNKAIDVLHEAIQKKNPDALETIIAAGKNYADNVHLNKSGEFSYTLASTRGRDSRIQNFAGSVANPTNNKYDKILPSKWLDYITDMILRGDWEKASTILNDRYGQIITKPKVSVKQPGEIASVGDNSLVGSGANVMDSGQESAARKIVSPEVAPLLAALIDWSLNKKLYHNSKTKEILSAIKTGEYADISVEGTGIFGGGKKESGRKAADYSMEEFIEFQNNITLFNNEMQLTEGTMYEVLDPINLKIGIFQPVTREMANTKFLNSNSVDSLNNIIRTSVKNDVNARAAYKIYERTIIRADKRAVKNMSAKIKTVDANIKEFQTFMNATTIGTGQKSLPFNFNASYEFLTAEGGRALKAFIAGSKDPAEATKLVRRILRQGYANKTTVQVIGDQGEFTAAYAIPSTGETTIRTDYITIPVTDRVVKEMDRIAEILTNKEYGVFAGVEHMEQARRIIIKSNKMTMKGLGLTDASWDQKAMAQIDYTDVPKSGVGVNQALANTLSFARRVVSPWFLGAVGYVRDLRSKNLNMFMAMSRSPEMTKLMHAALFDENNAAVLARDAWQGSTGTRIASSLADYWVDTEVNFQLNMKSPLSYAGLLENFDKYEHAKNYAGSMDNKIKDLDSVENIVKEGMVIQEQLDDIFGLKPENNNNIQLQRKN